MARLNCRSPRPNPVEVHGDQAKEACGFGQGVVEFDRLFKMARPLMSAPYVPGRYSPTKEMGSANPA